MNKNASIIITLALIIAIGLIFTAGSKSSNNKVSPAQGAQSVQNSEIKNGIQYITINAKSGYSPRLSQAKAGIPTKLIVKTDGTYDCSASLAIHSIGYQKILPQTGETEIDLGTPKAGEPLQGVCGMGMFSFVINFS